jgi:hypothetical protein
MKPRQKSVRRSKPTPAPDRALVQAKLAEGVKYKIVGIRPPLGLQAWEHALTCPLPLTVSYELLDSLRKTVLEYLDWVTQSMIVTDREAALEAIQRVADRLTRIAAMTPKALDSGVKEGRLSIDEELPF